MGKVDDNKQHKLDALLRSAYDLFIAKGISGTSIHDIVQKAGVAKGTFYLYFKDKNEIRDRLISKTAERYFMAAYQALHEQDIPEFEDKIIFIVDYVINELSRNKAVLRFVSKNLSWGVFSHAVTELEHREHVDLLQLFYQLLEETPGVTLRAPETMLFLIIELASSTSYSTILENSPMGYEELKPYLYQSIRSIIRNHIM